jgi:hypothetical protein
VVQVKDCQQGSCGPERARHGADVFRTLPWMNGTKTSVFENPVEPADAIRRESEEIRQLIGFCAGERKAASLLERARRYVQPNNLSSPRRVRNSAYVMAQAATGHEYFALQWSSACKPFEKRRRRRTSFPWRITRLVSLFPIHVEISNCLRWMSPGINEHTGATPMPFVVQ